MINIHISVRRPFSRYVLADEKHDELRKTVPLKSMDNEVTIYLYESGKNGNHAIIGKCEMYGASLVTESRGENAIRVLAARARVGFAELVNYLPCWDWKIGSPELFLSAVPLSAIGMTRPPQSWQYLTDEQAAILERRLAYKKSCANCNNNEGDYYCYTYGIISDLANCCFDWTPQQEEEQEEENEADA